MPYIDRDANQKIISVYERKQRDNQEFLQNNSQEYLNFLSGDYKKKRSEAYPSINDQLDMLYHDKKNGSSTWFDLITNIKLSIPKE